MISIIMYLTLCVYSGTCHPVYYSWIPNPLYHFLLLHKRPPLIQPSRPIVDSFIVIFSHACVGHLQLSISRWRG